MPDKKQPRKVGGITIVSQPEDKGKGGITIISQPDDPQRIPSSLDVNESVRRHHSPQPELLGLTPAEMNQPVGSSREPRQRATIGPAPTFLGSHNLYYAKKWAGGILWGKDDPGKLPHEQSTFDRLGVMGGPVSELTGIPMTKGQREEYSRMGGGLAGGALGDGEGGGLAGGGDGDGDDGGDDGGATGGNEGGGLGGGVTGGNEGGGLGGGGCGDGDVGGRSGG